MNLTLIFGFYGCNVSNNTSDDKPKPASKKISKQAQRKAKIEKQLEAARKLLAIAQSGTDENVQYVRLTPENNYIDPLSDGLFFTRDFSSGPGTGKFIGNKGKFEFTRGNCKELLNAPDTDNKKKIRWQKKIKKCREQILACEWCARLKEDHSVSYTISFLSWSIKNKTCVGDCSEHENMAAYVRVRSR